MSKINAVRFINLNYNNNAMKINDRFSNKLGVNYRFSGEGEDVDMEK